MPRPPKKKDARKKGGRYADTATGKMESARRNREKEYDRSLRLVQLLLANVHPSTIGPLGGDLASLKKREKELPEGERKRALTVHLPQGRVCWQVTLDEVAKYFSHLPRIPDDGVSEFDGGNRVKLERLESYSRYLKALFKTLPRFEGDTPTEAEAPAGMPEKKYATGRAPAQQP